MFNRRFKCNLSKTELRCPSTFIPAAFPFSTPDYLGPRAQSSKASSPHTPASDSLANPTTWTSQQVQYLVISHRSANLWSKPCHLSSGLLHELLSSSLGFPFPSFRLNTETELCFRVRAACVNPLLQVCVLVAFLSEQEAISPQGTSGLLLWPAHT